MLDLSEGHLRIDEFLPDYDFSATYDIRINAAPAVVYQCLFWLDFSEVWLVRLLESARTGKLLARSQLSTDLRQRLQGTGFVMLAEVPNEELVMGIAGQFYVSMGTLHGFDCRRLCCVRPARLRKGGWNFSLRSVLPQETILSTETRTKCFGPAAIWRFQFIGRLSTLSLV